MTQLIRLATVKDAPEVLNVTLRAYEPIRELNINFLAATADLQLVTNNIRRNLTYVLEQEGQIVSTVTVRHPWNDPDQFSPYPFIWWFAVDPLYKQKGFGSTLLTWVEENILRKQVKAPAVYLATAERHPWLGSIYERRGYEIFAERDHDGEKIVYLRKILDETLYRIIENKEPIVSN
ncbi:GNAT family N-acetyltransferase [Peribacillus simplex]|uniref:GNAT family N-acetyltransferase n=1 Tax=Peribacillus TaxID=2675229 RepID=UPI0019207C7F|nr:MULTISPECIES: GNAT family N-acetyltransferase [Peribacillus]MBD8588254.1 GNAT family N-acetyltransferase [Peribacillus simplex]MCP1094114.1 GNAT family N-acetyltransferase [Bacillaceae bacterium OS4b]MCP1151454.1 GNAT family N-acetyltransferase [Peribacillus frigoritolerans]MEA3575433.1 GNAT family N-acetyltransferase [Peribacillus frigoritolerans]